MNAVKFGSMEVVRVLLARNADPNYANRAGESAVHLAASSGIVDLVNMLINSSRSINLDAQDENGTVVTYIQVPLDSLSLNDNGRNDSFDAGQLQRTARDRWLVA